MIIMLLSSPISPAVITSYFITCWVRGAPSLTFRLVSEMKSSSTGVKPDLTVNFDGLPAFNCQ